MLEYNSAINKEINKDELTVKEISPIVKINLRGKKRDFFTTNPRMRMLVSSFDRMNIQKKELLIKTANDFIDDL